jgi:hypothetical protein
MQVSRSCGDPFGRPLLGVVSRRGDTELRQRRIGPPVGSLRLGVLGSNGGTADETERRSGLQSEPRCRGGLGNGA